MARYASRADLYTHGLAAAAMGSVSTAQQDAVLESVCGEADSKMAARFPTPLTGQIDPTITMNVCKIAAFEILRIRGFNPQNGADMVIREAAKEARAWFDAVERQHAHPKIDPLVSRAPVDLAAPNVQSKPLRGW